MWKECKLVSCTLQFLGTEISSEKRSISNKVWLIYRFGLCIWTDQNLQKVKAKNSRLFWSKLSASDCTSLPYFPTCQALKTGFELSRVKLHGKDPKGNKSFFEVARLLVIGSRLYYSLFFVPVYTLTCHDCTVKISFTFPIMHLIPTPPPPKKKSLHKHCFQFLLGRL